MFIVPGGLALLRNALCQCERPLARTAAALGRQVVRTSFHKPPKPKPALSVPSRLPQRHTLPPETTVRSFPVTMHPMPQTIDTPSSGILSHLASSMAQPHQPCDNLILRHTSNAIAIPDQTDETEDTQSNSSTLTSQFSSETDDIIDDDGYSESNDDMLSEIGHETSPPIETETPETDSAHISSQIEMRRVIAQTKTALKENHYHIIRGADIFALCSEQGIDRHRIESDIVSLENQSISIDSDIDDNWAPSITSCQFRGRIRQSESGQWILHPDYSVKTGNGIFTWDQAPNTLKHLGQTSFKLLSESMGDLSHWEGRTIRMTIRTYTFSSKTHETSGLNPHQDSNIDTMMIIPLGCHNVHGMNGVHSSDKTVLDIAEGSDISIIQQRQGHLFHSAQFNKMDSRYPATRHMINVAVLDY